MKIAVISPEVAPFSKSGGLGEVAGALPVHLAKAADVVVITPKYRGLKAHPSSIVVDVPLRDRIVRVGFETALLPGSNVPVYFVADDCFDRDGYYGDAAGDYPDNCERFVLFTRAALELLHALRFAPDIVHVHDWQAALAPAYLKTLFAGRFPRTKSVLTIHNLSYQGLFWHWDMPLTGLDWALFNQRQLEFWGQLSFLKGGIVFADAVTTVSPTYAIEIRTREQGCGLEGVLDDRRAALHGILNGIDVDTWNPATDALLPDRYSPAAMAGKSRNKAALRRRLGLRETDGPLFAFIGRIVEQKGIQLLLQALPSIASIGQVAILGAGDVELGRSLKETAALAPGRVSVTLGFDEALAHEFQGGADFLLMPSIYEPCGLSQMHAMRYGTIPIVRRTGGLADTVRDGDTGIVFEEATAEALIEAVRRATSMSPPATAAMRAAGMAMDFSWAVSAKKVLDLFRTLI